MISKREEELIASLNLIPHPEGGYFKETFRSGATPMQSQGATDPTGKCMDTDRDGSARNILTSIYWMLNRETPFGWWCKNASDHVHYFHEGVGLIYHVIDPDGQYSKHILGNDCANGEEPQLIVRGGCWKAVELTDKESFALIGEAVAPGFDFKDFQWGEVEFFKNKYGSVYEKLSHLFKENQNRNFGEYYQ